MSQPSVSICIVTYNSAADIGNCLDAIHRQTSANLSTVLVDNASKDATIEIVKDSKVRVTLIPNIHNNGFAAAQNQVLLSMNSDYILVLNPDVVLEPDYISNLVGIMENNPCIGSATGCLTFAANPRIIDSAGITMNRVRRAAERGAGKDSSGYAESCEVFGVSGAAAMYSRKMVDHISIDGQFFDEDFFAYKEDVDVAWRANLLGWKSWYEARANALHVRQWGAHSNRKQMALKIRRHSYQNRYLMMLKNENFNLSWWIKLPLLIAFEIALNGYFLLRDPKVLTGSWVDLMRLIPRAWRKRQKIKKLVTDNPNFPPTPNI
jgi:GT2 family glycosyltransferase